MQRLKDAWARFQTTRLWQTWQRYGDARGNLLAAGIAYFAFFSIFPALALGFTVFGVLLRGNPQWLDQIKRSLNETLPGFIEDGSGQGLIPLTLPSESTLTITGLIGLAGLVLAGLGWFGAVRDGIRAVFGVSGSPGNAVTAKVRDLAMFVFFGLAIVVSAGLSGVAGAGASAVAEALGLGRSGWLVGLVGVVVGALLDAVVVLMMIRFLAGVAVPRKGLIHGALVGGVGLTILKLLGATVIQGTKDNPLFASVALVVGLLAWLNLMSRVVLFAAAWSANWYTPPPEDETADAEESTDPGEAAKESS